MKILYCKNSFAGRISGADEIIVKYAIGMKGAGHTTAVMLLQPPIEGHSLAARLETAGVPLSWLASSNFRAALDLGRKFAVRAMYTFPPGSLLIRSQSRRLVFNLLQRYHNACCEFLTSYQPDLVHVMTPDPGAVMFINAAHAVGIPVIYQEVGMPFHPPGFEDVYERFTKVLPLCTEVAVLSPTLAHEMDRLLPKGRTSQVLPLICDEVRNGKSPNRKGDSSVCFGFAARLEYLKGPLEFVNAFRIAHHAIPDATIKLAGEGSQRKDIVTVLKSSRLEQNCELIGTYTTEDERNNFMHDIDVFVLPSRTEGTPNAVIEAMAHGKPIIATNVGGLPDFVTAEVGILVNPGDTSALSQAMIRLASDHELRSRMGIAARAKYEQLFTAQVVQPLLVDYYKRVISQSSNGHTVPHSIENSNHPWARIRRRPRGDLILTSA